MMRIICWLSSFLILSIFLFSCAVPVEPDGPTGPIIPSIDDSSSISIVTWNLKYFPQQTTRSVERVQQIMDSLNADFYCIQEIYERDYFDDVMNGIDQYEVIYSNHDYLALAIVYKQDSFLPASTTHLFENDNYNFARRAPLLVSFEYQKSGVDQVINLIDLHMKCCEEVPSDLERRHDASQMLYDYLQNARANGDSNFVVAGDWNDDIHDPDGSGLYAFEAFLNDPDNFYYITDSLAATRSVINASYPSWNSFIDNILISRSLFDEAAHSEVRTLRLEEVFGDYSSVVSDHRPVLWSFIPN